jgi:hypothetical protein
MQYGTPNPAPSSEGFHAITDASVALDGISSQRRHGDPVRGGRRGGMAEIFVIWECGTVACLDQAVQLTVDDVASGIHATYE